VPPLGMLTSAPAGPAGGVGGGLCPVLAPFAEVASTKSVILYCTALYCTVTVAVAGNVSSSSLRALLRYQTVLLCMIWGAGLCCTLSLSLSHSHTQGIVCRSEGEFSSLTLPSLQLYLRTIPGNPLAPQSLPLSLVLALTLPGPCPFRGTPQYSRVSGLPTLSSHYPHSLSSLSFLLSLSQYRIRSFPCTRVSPEAYLRVE